MSEEKLRECFEDMVVYKNLKQSNFFSALSLPSFLRDWLLRKFEDEDGNYDTDEIAAFIHEFIPQKNDWVSIKNRIINGGERVKFLTKIAVDINIATSEISFSLPDFGLSRKETIIEPRVWEQYQDELVKDNEVWGVVELGYRPPDEYAKPKIPGKISLISFTNFCPYEIDLDYYKDVRSEFTVKEWIDIILGAIDYNAAGFEDENQKMVFIRRLLPFVEKRVNLIELAPKGTGKSYLFSSISKFGWLSSGGTMSRAKLFYDISRRATGLVSGYDYVALDEIQTITFPDVFEMRGALKGYMEKGTYTVGNYEGVGEAGIILLGNIKQERMNEYDDMFIELPTAFHESALLDRFHGFIRGWDAPRMHDDMKMSGWALNSEYFCSIMHMLRDDVTYRAIVDQVIDVPPHADTRDTEAVKRITTAFLKLLFPNVRSAEDIDPKAFLHYCLRPALDMRGIIKVQLGIMDVEFRGKDLPDLKLKDEYLER